jgi:hypothetical protein
MRPAWQTRSEEFPGPPPSMAGILTDALARQDAVSVRAAVSSYLRGTPRGNGVTQECLPADSYCAGDRPEAR